MNETVMNSHHAEQQSKPTTTLKERFEKVGYQCLLETCDKYTMQRFIPIRDEVLEYEPVIPLSSN